MKNDSIFNYIAANPYSFESLGEQILKERRAEKYQKSGLLISVISMLVAIISLFL